MKKESRTVRYDRELQLEAYCFQGITQPFPNHIHEYYVIGLVEQGEDEADENNRQALCVRGHSP